MAQMAVGQVAAGAGLPMDGFRLCAVGVGPGLGRAHKGTITLVRVSHAFLLAKWSSGCKHDTEAWPTPIRNTR